MYTCSEMCVFYGFHMYTCSWLLAYYIKAYKFTKVETYCIACLYIIIESTDSMITI